jgi:cytochrome c-type biogenesis protein CcmI
MIWFLLLALVGLVLFYLMAPLLSEGAQTDLERDAQLEEARQQRAVIDADDAAGRLNPDAAVESREALDRRVLALLDDKDIGAAPTIRRLALYIVPAVILIGTVAGYNAIGAPSYEPITIAEFQAQQVADGPQSLDELVVTLQRTLEADQSPPYDGYVLLARSLMTLGRFDEGLSAYERAIALSDDLPEVVEEHRRAIEYAQQARTRAPRIDSDTAAAIQAMSPEEQQAMIGGMVEGLAARLEQNPEDAAGWARLIRARVVLGQIEQAQIDLQTARRELADTPDGIGVLEPAIKDLNLK